MKLIAEDLTPLTEIKTSIDEATKEKDCYIEGIFLQGEIVNGNGRMYPMHVLDKAVNEYQDKIKNNRSLGELNHPNSPSINYERVAIKTISLVKDGNNYIGKAKLTSSPLGELCKNLIIKDGVQMAVSSRGLGSIQEKNGVSVVQDDFYIAAAADIVSDPSAPDAWVNGVMEDREWVYEGGILVERKLQEVKDLGKKSAKRLEENKIILFKEFCNLLSK